MKKFIAALLVGALALASCTKGQTPQPVKSTHVKPMMDSGGEDPPTPPPPNP